MTTDLVVLVDPAGNAIGTADRIAVHSDTTPLHLAFSFYGFDDDGAFVATRRAGGKRTFPGLWTNTCCGHPRPGERLAYAARRRVREELGLAVGRLWLALPRFAYRSEMPDGTVENEVCPVLVGTVSGQPTADEAEVAEVRRLPWEGFLTDLRRDPAGHSPWAALQAPQLDASGFVDIARSRQVLGGAA